ncbi:hypothetical protein D3C85_1601860 [compost metagenome]
MRGTHHPSSIWIDGNHQACAARVASTLPLTYRAAFSAALVAAGVALNDTPKRLKAFISPIA